MSQPRTPSSDDHVWATGPTWIESPAPLARLARPARDFLRIEAAGSVLLLLAAVVALVWANSPLASSYSDFWHTPVSITVGEWSISESLQHWVNDALMVVFFFVVGLEIKYELVLGDLKDPRAAALPVVAALGGMAVPALLYVAFTNGSEGASGWGIPMATDIAFAVGVLGLLGRRIPTPARLFLLTLAIADDIGAILVIAVFYTAEVSLGWLAGALVLLAVVVVMRLRRVWWLGAYLAIGLAVWFCLLSSGVHATLAGVALGLLAPAAPLLRPDVAADHAARALADHELDPDEVRRLEYLLTQSLSPVDRLQGALHGVSAFVVLPIFALANAGVSLAGVGEALSSPVGLGVLVGLVVGKPLGVLAFTWVAVRFGLGSLPQGTSWPMVAGLGAVAGIGFTVSLFVTGLSFPGQEALADAAKVAILIASLLAAVIGVVILLVATRGAAPDRSQGLPS